MTAGIVALLERRLRDRPFAGARIYVSRNGRCLVDEAFGEARPGVAMCPQTVVHLSCAGKPLLAAVVLSLVEAGLIALADPVHRHLPGFETGGKGAVTVDDVLSHAGGFRFFDGPGPYLDSFGGFLRRVMSTTLEPDWRPGVDQGYHYETGWYVLAALTEAKLGVPYDDAIADVVLKPLGMRSTWATMSRATYQAVSHQLAVPSFVQHGVVRRSPFLISASACRTRCPSYGYFGTIDDLARFYEAAIAGLDSAADFPLAPATLRLMTTSARGPVQDRTWKAEYAYSRGFYRGLAGTWGYGKRWSPSSFGMSGLVGHTVAAADPQTGVVVAASFGALADSGDDIARLTDHLYDTAMADTR
ncbi:serine hydrolase domain-containing protein [Hamadaea sp. NPDC051192]|uniref:serine hydrolase domain-containing protein n=1 Tax=Hamadaea sp. NPDC051192 TaxID=3154940 RepID=UPI0034381CF4